MHGPAARSLESHKFRLSDTGFAAKQSSHSSGVLAGKIRHLERLSTDQTPTFRLASRGFRIMSDKPTLSDIVFPRQARRFHG
jgi:hypothetical protein